MRSMFLLAFIGGSFFTEVITESFDWFGSVVVGLVIGVIFWEWEKALDKIERLEKKQRGKKK